MAKKSKLYDVDDIIAYEGGDMNRKQELNLFSSLVKTGDAWKLQGHYGRTASAYMESGLIDEKGNITKRGKEFAKGEDVDIYSEGY